MSFKHSLSIAIGIVETNRLNWVCFILNYPTGKLNYRVKPEPNTLKLHILQLKLSNLPSESFTSEDILIRGK